jgi:hypothetical protein
MFDMKMVNVMNIYRDTGTFKQRPSLHNPLCIET